MRKRICLGPALLVILIFPTLLFGGRRQAQSRDIKVVDLPLDYSVDFQLALEGLSRILRMNRPLVGTQLNEVGEEVFTKLVSETTISALGLPYKWNLTLLDNDVLNASSDPAGQVYMNGGLAHSLGTNRGLWAAALSHEISHTALRHHVRLYLQRLYIAQQLQYWRWRARNGDNSANWVVLGLAIAGPIALNKMSRDQESHADTRGMMLMARAGYHPDFVFALHHLMQVKTGDQSKLGAFFSDHPRWVTRDQRSERAYADALAEYNGLWPDPVASPGGTPPVVAFLGEPSAQERKRAKTTDVTLPIYCRNASGPLTLLVRLEGKHDVEPSFFQHTVSCTDKDDAEPVGISIPAANVTGRDRKVKVDITVLDPDRIPIGRSKTFKAHVPKP